MQALLSSAAITQVPQSPIVAFRGKRWRHVECIINLASKLIILLLISLLFLLLILSSLLLQLLLWLLYDHDHYDNMHGIVCGEINKYMAICMVPAPLLSTNNTLPLLYIKHLTWVHVTIPITTATTITTIHQCYTRVLTPSGSRWLLYSGGRLCALIGVPWRGGQF